MKRLLLSILALAVIVIGIALARSPAEVPVNSSFTAGDSSILSFSIPDSLMVRIDDQYVIPAFGASVFARQQGGDLVDLDMRFAIDRVETLKLRPPNFSMEVDAYTLLSMSPDRPVYITVQAKPELLDMVASQLREGAKLGDLAALPDFTGFPMLFNLDNYTFRGITQEGGEQ